MSYSVVFIPIKDCFPDPVFMLYPLKINARATFLLTTVFTFILLLPGCGDSSNVIDELESERPDSGLNDDLPIDAPKACLGKITTTSSHLNIRTTPQIADNVCGSIPPQSYVTILDTNPVNGFYTVLTDFCSEQLDQFASSAYIELSEDCDSSNSPPQPPEGPANPIENLGEYIQQHLQKVSVTRELIRGGAKGLVEVYKVPGSGENSLCGSKHIRAYRSEPFQGKDTLCAWTAVAQEWREKYCPDNSPHCRIMIGDQSFGERIPSSWPHSTHRRGWCMDIWPMRNTSCGEKEITWKQSCYSRNLTKNFVELLVKHGADKGNQLFFNDPQIPHVRPLANHDDHIHACFKPSNSIVQLKCTNTIVKPSICPEYFTSQSNNLSAL